MNKKIIWAIICTIFVSAIIFAYRSFSVQTQNHDSKKQSLTYPEFERIISELLNPEDIKAIDLQGVFEDAHARITSPSAKKQFFVLGLPSMSGTGGVGGVIIEIDPVTKRGILIGGYYAGDTSEFLFSPNETYVSFKEVTKGGPSCVYAYEYVFQTGTSSDSVTKLSPPMNDPQGSDLYIEISDPHWANDGTLQFTAGVASCDFANPSAVPQGTKSSNWQYDLKTKTYKQVN